ncbi:MAG: tetratricopeptide repeat protein [Gemmatimonadaceae bacterium]
MSNVEKLKKKAAEFEQKKQFDRALEVYLQIIGATENQEEKDVTVYNRIGDLYLRLNKPDKAVEFYEQAVDLYTDGGYLNNAIALCNKILRHAPSRHQIYYKLGKISAKKGFNSDAKKNFLEYADRMHRAGRDSDAFKALQEFADLCPGQDDIRLMLADQLARAGKKDEAVEQLQILHESLDAEGRTAEAEATVQRIHSLDPAVEPRRSTTPRTNDSSGLVFLDLGGSPSKPQPKIAGLQRTSLMPELRQRPKTPPHVQPAPEFDALPDIDPSVDIPGLQRQGDSSSLPNGEPAFDLTLNDLEISPLEGLESAADPIQFALDPEVNPDQLDTAVSGFIPSEPLREPGLGEPLNTQDPLAGLSLLEEPTFSDGDANPLDGLLGTPEPPMSGRSGKNKVVQEPGESPAPADEEERELEPIELDIAEPEPVKASAKARPKPVEPEPEEEEEVEEPEPVRPKPKLVQPVRPTRPKKLEPKSEPEPASKSERRPINPFQRAKPKPKDPSPAATPRLSTPPKEVPHGAAPKENTPPQGRADNFVDLADWLRDDSRPRSTRMIAEEDEHREDGEQADFTDMLEKFKAGVAANVDEEDFDSHYDLGVAYKQMGLIDEAVAEFQKALRGATQRIRAYEALGQCFIERHEYDVAITVLGRALREPGMEDEDLIGVLYLLGYASEHSRKPRDASAYYQRVFAIDVDFRDVSKRLKQMSKAASK